MTAKFTILNSKSLKRLKLLINTTEEVKEDSTNDQERQEVQAGKEKRRYFVESLP